MITTSNLKTIQIYSLIVLEARNPKLRCWRVIHCSFTGPTREPRPHLFQVLLIAGIPWLVAVSF